MEGHLWQLPGPAQFLQSIVQDLRSGKNLVLSFPLHAPDGLREAMAERVREHDLWRWRIIRATDYPSDGVVSLTQSLHDNLLPEQKSSEIRSVVTLAQKLVGTIVWVEETADQHLQIWYKFLAQYQHACQSIELHDRSLFCLPVSGSQDLAPLDDVALSVRRWEGVIRRLDMPLYLDAILSQCVHNQLHHKVAMAVTAELAGFDFRLARFLAREQFSVIMNPFEVLCSFAAERGWTRETVRQPEWHDGMQDIVDGNWMVHSAAVAAMGDSEEISRRVWRGQVAILYPFIEEQRCGLIPLIRGYLQFPLRTAYGMVHEAEDLEIGHMLYHLRGKRVPRETWRLLNYLTDMRHSLAHLRPVPTDSLFAGEILKTLSFNLK